MSILLTKDLSKKIRMFIEIVDKEKLGVIDFDHTEKLCFMSMSWYNQDWKSFIPEFGHFFAKLIFKMFNASESETIKFSDLEERFKDGLAQDKFLIALFCCTDPEIN